jgi:uncharacterized protein
MNSITRTAMKTQCIIWVVGLFGLMLHSAGSQAWAQTQVQSADTAPSASVVLDLGEAAPTRHKPIVSWAARRFAGIVTQGLDYSCGASALATLLRALGQPVHEAQVVQGMLTDENRQSVMQRGFSMLDMKNYVETLGLSASGFKVDVSKLYELKIPVIALITQNNIAHFVVIKRASDGRMYVADPARGHRVVPEKEFEAMWSGLVLAVLGGAGYSQQAEILRKDPGALQWRETAAREAAYIAGSDHVYFQNGQF